MAQAPQVRSLTEGVYSAAQAARGQQLYKAQCAACHGNSLEGASGPPLAGDGFVSNWSARSVDNLVDKIQKTMPFNLPGSLSRRQSTDLAAYVLQAGKFPSGQSELSEAALAQIVFPTVPSVANVAPPEGNLAELMRAIAFPNSNIIFNVQIKDPGAQTKKAPAAAPFDYVEWGSTVYPGWLAIDQAAIAITESAPLLLTPGRRCQNGRPEAVRKRTRGCRKARPPRIPGEELRSVRRYQRQTERCVRELSQGLPRQGRHRREWSHSMPARSAGEIMESAQRGARSLNCDKRSRSAALCAMFNEEK